MPQTYVRATKQQREICNVLKRDTRHVLGIIATSIPPLSLSHFKAIFPKLEWDKHCGRLIRAGLIEKRHRFLLAKDSAKRAILSDKKERDELSKVWIRTLTDLEDHVDGAMFLASHYIQRDEPEKAALILIRMVESGNLGHWNELYCRILGHFEKPKLYRQLTPKTRIKFCNALGLVYSYQGKQVDALQWFRKLKCRSRRASDSWGLGQAHINAGVAHERAGHQELAKRCFQDTIKHARRHRDMVLLGRGLNNLAHAISIDDPEAAMRLADESLTVKRKVEDDVGVVTTLAVLGRLSGIRGRYDDAAEWFRKSLKQAQRLDLTYESAMAFHGLGCANFDLGRAAKSISCIDRALEIAKDEGFEDVQAYSALALARVYFTRNEFGKCRNVLRRHLSVVESAGQSDLLINAIHGLGLAALAMCQWKNARKLFNRALRKARKNGSSSWSVRCIAARAKCSPKLKTGAELQELRTSARNEERRGAFIVAAGLYQTLAHEHINRVHDDEQIESAFGNAIRCYRSASVFHVELTETYVQLYTWRWESGDHCGGLDALECAEAEATKSGQQEARISLLDERGTRLQELERLAEAEALHRSAIKLARRTGTQPQLHLLLNNLGECLGRLDKPDQALKVFAESEQLARSERATEAAIISAHNRALALLDLGRKRAGEKLLERCRDEAQRHSLWIEHTRACESLADLARTRRDFNVADKLYKQAMRIARTRKLPHLCPHIALSHAALLRSMGCSPRARQILEQFKDKFLILPNTSLYFSELARVYSDIGDFDLTVDACFSAWSHAIEESVDCDLKRGATALAGMLAGDNGLKSTDKQLGELLKRARSKRRRTLLMIGRMSVSLASGREDAAEEYYEKAKALAESAGFHDLYIGLHVLLGDHQLLKTPDDRLPALQAYIIGMLAATDVAIDRATAIGGHIVAMLLHDANLLSISALDSLLSSVSKWLINQGLGRGALFGFATWPLRLVRGITSNDSDPQELLQILDNPTDYVNTVPT